MSIQNEYLNHRRVGKNIHFIMVLQGFGPFSLVDFPTLQDGLRGLQDRAKTAQDASKRAP